MKTEKTTMHWGASAKIFDYARQLRENLTEAESLLWEALRLRRLDGYKFRNQHPIGTYIVDFYCHEKRLAIEVDGGYHNQEAQKIHDKFREEDLNRAYVTVIRFSNEEVTTNLPGVLEKIRNTMEAIKENQD